EDMHGEAFLINRQTWGYKKPVWSDRGSAPGPVGAVESAGSWSGDVAIPGGELLLGATVDEPFVFDNEKWAHPVRVEPFVLARAPVTQAEFAAFVEDGGYRRREWWSAAGWQWREAVGVQHPVYWRRDGNDWLRRDFDEWQALEPHRPVINVCW